MLGGGVERGLPQLQLLPQRPGLFGEQLKALGTAFQRRHRRVDLRHAAFHSLHRSHHRGHQFLDACRLRGVGREGLQLLVGGVHTSRQPFSTLVELRRGPCEVGQPGVQLLDELAARLDLGHRLRQAVGVRAHRFDRRLHLFHCRELAA